jgi:glutamyl-tRNA reductase
MTENRYLTFNPFLNMTLLSLGINHQTAPVDIREKIAFSPEQLSGALLELQKLPEINESVIVSTCNRTEIYCDAVDDSRHTISDWLSNFHNMENNSLTPYLYQHANHEVARHLFRVASGLDSMVLGESQILGQLKSSYDQARLGNSVNTILDRLFQHSFSVAKRVRTDTDIGSHPVSVAFSAVNLSKQIFGDLCNQRALLIGAGETIELVARHLKSQGIQSIVIANRSLEKAQILAQTLSATATSISAVPEELVNADIVISSTASQLPILGKGATEAALKLRRHRPIFMVDLAVPRDIESQVGDLEDVYLYTVDDLKNVVDENMRIRELAATAAQEIINIEVTTFSQWLKTHQSADHIRQLRNQTEIIKQQCVDKAMAQFEQDNDAKKALLTLANTLTNKMLHAPTLAMRKAIKTDDQATIQFLKSLSASE